MIFSFAAIFFYASIAILTSRFFYERFLKDEKRTVIRGNRFGDTTNRDKNLYRIKNLKMRAGIQLKTATNTHTFVTRLVNKNSV